MRQSNTNRNFDIWVVDTNTGSSTPLTSQEATNYFPLWSPSGKRILFSASSLTPGGTIQLLSVAADGSGTAETVMTGPRRYAASWSSERLAYLEFQGNRFQIWTRPMSGPGEPKRFGESKFDMRDAEFSPDGHWMAYVSNESGADEVYVQAFPAGEKHKVSTQRGENPAWGRNGRELFYLQPEYSGEAFTGTSAVMAVDFAAGREFEVHVPHKLFEGRWMFSTPLRSYDVTPDGYFLMERLEDPPDQRVTKLNVVLNWFEELKRRAPPSGQ